MKNFTLNLAKKLNIIKYIAEKSVFLMLILAIVWQSFPRVTSLAQTIDSKELANLVADSQTEPVSAEDKIIAIIREVAKQENYGNPELAIAIARAESRLNPDIRGEADKRDRGLYQINSHFNPEVTDQCAFDPICATKWTIKELKAGRAWKWNASKYKWGKYAYQN